MTGGTKGGGDNNIALGGTTQAFFFGECFKTLKNFRINVGGGFFQDSVGSRQVQSSLVGSGRSIGILVLSFLLLRVRPPTITAKSDSPIGKLVLVENGAR